MTTRSRRNRGQLHVEIVLAVVAAAAAFVLAGLVSSAAQSRVPALLLGLLFLAAVLAVARLAGVVYAVPVGLVTLEAFDWYFLPPLRDLDLETLFVVGASILISVLVAEIASRAGRRADASEEARGLLADEQAALRRVATLVARGVPPTEVFAAVAEEIGRLVLAADSTAMLRYEADGSATVVAAWTSEPSDIPVGARWTLEGENVAGTVFRTGRPARMDDYENATGSVAALVREMGVRSLAGAPVVVDQRLWGVMMMAAGSMKTEPLPVGMESRLAEFTDLVAAAIANAEAHSELERVAAEQAVLGRVATLVAEAAPSTDLFAAVAAEIGGLFDVSIVGLFRYGPDRTATAIAVSGGLSAYLGRSLSFPPDDPSILGSLLRTGRPTRIDDYSGVGGVGAEFIRETGIGSAVGVPVIVEGRIWGAVILGLEKGRPTLPADTVDRLTAFTELVATAIANAEARAEIERLAQEQAALRRVATLVARGVQPGEVFAAVAQEIGRVLDAAVAFVVRYEADATATVVAKWGGDDDGTPAGSNWSLEGASATAEVFRTRRSARMDSYDEASGELAEEARRLGRRPGIAAPILIEDRLWGAAVANARSDRWPDSAEGRIANFADLIATAISNAETRTELAASRARVVTAADETRRRIERDLHDGIQQRLVTLALKARATATMTPPSNETQGELSLIADGLGDALDELQVIARGIHPAILTKGGLGPALKALSRRSAVPVTLELDLETRLEEQVEVAAYYVASECLNNAVKHAEASVVELRVEHGNSLLSISIRDDGIGGADPSRGSGLIGLTDRVEALGGTISVASPPGEGTTLHVQLPVDPAAAPTRSAIAEAAELR